MKAKRTVEPSIVASDLLDRHLKPQELADAWGVSKDHILRLFAKEPGVVDIGNGKHRVIRIPKPVADRVYRRRIVCPSPTRARRQAC